MNNIILPFPTADDFNHLGDIWRREADGREALGAALEQALGQHFDLAEEAAALRRRAENPQVYWPLLVDLHGPAGLVRTRADRMLPDGLYGQYIAEAAETKLIAAADCERCQSALQLSAEALRDFSAWVAGHIHPSRGLAERAAWDAAEADHLGHWAERLRTEFLADVIAGAAF